MLFVKSRRAQTVDDYETWLEGEIVNTLNQFDIGDIRTTTLVTEVNNSVIRRLTPVECERLQGFPDGWTDEKTDTQRYKQMGNAVTVNVIEWIGSRL